MKRIGVIALVVLVLGMAVYFPLSSLSRARTQINTQARETQVVYDAWAFAGEKYSDVFYPQSVDTLYLIGEEPNLILPKLTQVYYWPLTLEYKADWDAMNQPLTGVIEILKNGQPIREIEPTPYSLYYAGITPQRLVFGDQAQAEYAHFQADSKQVSGELDAYYNAMIAYQTAYEDYLSQIKKGDLNAKPPQEPAVQPPAIGYYVSKPSPGYPINLPPGNYSLRLKTPDGRIVEGTEKKLLVFTPRREGVSYAVFTEDRWTKQEIADNPQAMIYLKSGEILYVQPYAAFEVDQYGYSKLTAPQQPAVGQNTWEWVLSNPLNDSELQVSAKNLAGYRLQNEPYIVEQGSGSKLGYSILPFSAQPGDDKTPAFYAFRVEVPEQEASVRIQLMDKNGQPLPGSEREIRKIRGSSSNGWYLLSVLPLLIGAAVIGWRRSRTGRRGANIQ